MQHGHGPLKNILDNYTLSHVNHFLTEIDKRSRRSHIERITEARIAQTSNKDYQQIMGRLRQQERMVQRREAQRYGHKVKHKLTPEEQQKLDAQDHVWLSDMSPEEQEKFRAEQNMLWEQIPPHLREKAERMTRGN